MKLNKLILGLLVASGVLLAQNEKFTIYTENYPPMSTKEVDGKIGGIATDIVNEVFKRANIKADFKLHPWARTYKMVQINDNSFIYTLGRNAKREESFQWIGPIMIREAAFYGLKSQKDVVPVDSFEKLKNYKIGVMNEDSTHQILLKNGLENRKHIFPVTKSGQNSDKLFHKRIDVALFNNYSVGIQLAKKGYSGDDVQKIMTITSGGYYIGANLNVSKDIVSKLQKAMESIQKSDFLEKLHKEHNLDYNKKLYEKNGFGK